MTSATSQMRRGLGIKPLHIVGIGIILITVVFGMFGFKDAFRSYTTDISEAERSGRHVQLAGFLGSTGAYDTQGYWTFMLEDAQSNQVKVIYAKPRPANFEQAVSIVAIGRYDKSQDVFVADDLLVKCPSKYQEDPRT